MTTWNKDEIRILSHKLSFKSKKVTKKQNERDYSPGSIHSAYSYVLFAGNLVFYMNKKTYEWTQVNFGFYTNVEICLLGESCHRSLLSYLKLSKKYKDELEITNDEEYLIIRNKSNNGIMKLKAIFNSEDIQVVLDAIKQQTEKG